MRAFITIAVLLTASPAFAHCCHTRTREHYRCHVRHVSRTCCTTQVAAAPCVAPVVLPEPKPTPVVVAPDSIVIQEKTVIKEKTRRHVEHQHRGETIVAPEAAK